MRNPGRDPGRDVRDDDGAQPAPRRDEEHRDREGPLPEESARRPYRREGRDRDERRSRNDRLRYLLSGLEAAPSPSRSSVRTRRLPGARSSPPLSRIVSRSHGAAGRAICP